MWSRLGNCAEESQGGNPGIRHRGERIRLQQARPGVKKDEVLRWSLMYLDPLVLGGNQWMEIIMPTNPSLL